jgi:hypothetical protein
LPPAIFTKDDIARIRTAAAQGRTGGEIALMLGKTPQQIRRKCCELGIQLRDTRKTVWHRLRCLIEPMISKALTLAARKRGMRAGDLARRILTAVIVHDLVDDILDANARVYKVGSIVNAVPVLVEDVIEEEHLLIEDHAALPLASLYQPQLNGSI